MRLTTITLAAVVALSSASFAETTAPGDIKFGENGEVEISLTGTAGDAASGRKIFMNRKTIVIIKNNCVIRGFPSLFIYGFYLTFGFYFMTPILNLKRI